MAAQISHLIISSILKHDRKVNSYKFALLRSINDVVLSFPDMRTSGLDIAIPLRLLAEFWVAYYWSFADVNTPILQGFRMKRGDKLTSDMSFRQALTEFRYLWESHWGGLANPADGYFVIHELRVPRNRETYPLALLQSYQKTLIAVADAIRQPIQYAGQGEWTIFPKPVRLSDLENVVAIPNTQPNEVCLVINTELWQIFRDLSLWIEALCIHEWCLFVEKVDQLPEVNINRGIIYTFLTARPDNRRPLTWERNQIDLLLMEGAEFICPWTQQSIRQNIPYALDHLVPVAVYPINELWNLVPSNPEFNSHQKRDRLPSPQKLSQAKPHLMRAYTNYLISIPLERALTEDSMLRFSSLSFQAFPETLATAVHDFISSIVETRNIAQF